MENYDDFDENDEILDVQQHVHCDQNGKFVSLYGEDLDTQYEKIKQLEHNENRIYAKGAEIYSRHKTLCTVAVLMDCCFIAEYFLLGNFNVLEFSIGLGSFALVGINHIQNAKNMNAFNLNMMEKLQAELTYKAMMEEKISQQSQDYDQSYR